MQETSEKYEQLTFPEPICGVQGFPAKTSVSAESNLVLKESVQVCFSQLQALLQTSKKKIDPLCYFLRTLKTYLALIEDLTLPDFSLNWTKSGTMHNGRLSTLPTSCLRTESECSLSQVLEEETDQKYFLSEKAMERLMSYKDLQQEHLPHEQGNQTQSECMLLKVKSMRKKQIVKCINPRNGNKQTQQQDRIYDINGHMTSLSAQQNGRFNIAIPYHQKAIGGLYSNDSKKFHRGILPDCSRALKADKHDACVAILQRPHGNNKGGIHKTAPTLTTSCYEHNNVVIIQTSNKQYIYAVWSDIYNSYISIRKLTPLECWRLHGWSDEDFFKAFFLNKELGIRFNRIYQKHKQNPVRLMGWAFKHQKMSDSQLYKQAGNGVTVTVIQRIGERLEGEQ